MLDLPAPGHLLDDQFGVHPDLDVGSRVEPKGTLQAGQQTGILGDVVAREAERFGAFEQHRARRRVADQRPEARHPRVPPRAAVGFDDESSGHAYSPDSGERTRIRRHSSQRMTSSTGAALMRDRSTWLSSNRQPPQRRCFSSAAPIPPAPVRILA